MGQKRAHAHEVPDVEGSGKRGKGDLELPEGDSETLIRVVKECQLKGYEGDQGDWKAFVKQNKGKLGPDKADPARQTHTMLAGFVRSLFSNKKRVKMVKRHQRYTAQLQAEKAAAFAEQLRWGSTEAKQPQPEGMPETGPWPGIVRLVKTCQAHSRFNTNYTMQSYQRGWQRIQRTPFDFSSTPRLISIDCEMCCTADQDRELLKVSVVDEEGNSLLDRLVLPRGEVTDFKTEVTGLTADNLKGVTYTRSNAQQDLLRLIGSPSSTILVGHSLHSDLQALRLDWQPVIDTALLFRYQGLPRASPSLAHLASTVLSKDIRQGDAATHDSVEDAHVAMELVRWDLKNGASPLLPPPDTMVEEGDLCQLMVHSIGKAVDLDDIKALFEGCRSPPQSFSDSGRVSKKRRVYAVFGSAKAADKAFKELKAAEVTDNCGRPQKRISLAKGPGDKKASGQVVVRKMASDGGRLFGRDSVQVKQQ
mmetsp:Transcript_32399/g.91809  ORF Transcript_32399/g.91809 Transcript_32399/m.91809 type:complete len:477 (+) Transcript_32399:225-1655(+)